ncbi:MAG: glycosyltransferase [Myxococcaceae bacterium]|nr:glycosyltransferase [Myxococcaceae bacterium]
MATDVSTLVYANSTLAEVKALAITDVLPHRVRSAELAQTKQALWAAEDREATLLVEKQAMEQSRSWKLTQPLRGVMGETRTRAERLQANWKNLSTDFKQQLTRLLDNQAPVQPISFAANEGTQAPTVVVFAFVPFDDVGGGQRSAQLTRALTAQGHRVIYVHLLERFDFALGRHQKSNVSRPGLRHLSIDDTTPQAVLDAAGKNAVVLFEAPHPALLPYLKACNKTGLATVFELIDDWNTTLGDGWFSEDTAAEFIRHARVVAGTARSLVDVLQARGRADALYVPNAADEQLFRPAAKHAKPAEFEAGKRALLYVGSLYGDWFSWEHIRSAAAECPDDFIYLIGDCPPRRRLPPNVRALGPRSIEQVPAYLAHTDIALLPFAPGKVSTAVSPIKVFEYLFMGKPVVATDLPEIRGYPGVSIAHSVTEFGRLCATPLAAYFDPQAFIAGNTWTRRVEQLLRHAQVVKS